MHKINEAMNISTTDICRRHKEALDGLAANIWKVKDYPHPVLVEGGGYPGVWLECAPHEGLVYGRVNPEIARLNHDIFFTLQREDGYIPCWVWKEEIGTGQIQMVVPIAATALETADLIQDEAFLAKAYASCVRWDDWLVRHRNTRGTGLCECFCEYDTGHDNSPRFAGLPLECPGRDASVCPQVGKLPYLAPDLSATMYGGRIALSKMAAQLGKMTESQVWMEKAETLRLLILKHCYHPDDECFYDVDCDGNFVRIRGDAMLRVLGEHVVDQQMFDRICERYISNPKEFWPPYPFPSISIADPAFAWDMPPNAWAGPSMGLAALRAPRWLPHYGRADLLDELMRRWISAIMKAPGFMQQMNPITGEFSCHPGYSPTMLVFLDFVERLGLLHTSP
jgi:Trehalase